MIMQVKLSLWYMYMYFASFIATCNLCNSMRRDSKSTHYRYAEGFKPAYTIRATMSTVVFQAIHVYETEVVFST